MPGFQLKRIGTIMEPGPGNALEVEGVLNPANARFPDSPLTSFLALSQKTVEVERILR